MHEIGLSEAIVEATLRRAQGRSVESVRVRVGGHPVDADVVNQGFQLAAMGTEAENATVEIVSEPLVVRCRDCGVEAPASDALHLAACAQCGGIDVEAVGTEEIVLEWIALRAPEGEIA